MLIKYDLIVKDINWDLKQIHLGVHVINSK